MPERVLAVGVDLGGTKIYSLVADANGNVLADDRRSTQAAEGANAVIDRIVASVRQALDEASVDTGEIVGLGISTPGPCDPQSGVVT